MPTAELDKDFAELLDENAILEEIATELDDALLDELTTLDEMATLLDDALLLDEDTLLLDDTELDDALLDELTTLDEMATLLDDALLLDEDTLLLDDTELDDIDDLDKRLAESLAYAIVTEPAIKGLVSLTPMRVKLKPISLTIALLVTVKALLPASIRA